jgi:hypothetical protein
MEPRVHLPTSERHVLAVFAFADQAFKRGLNVNRRRRAGTNCKQFEWFANFAT